MTTLVMVSAAACRFCSTRIAISRAGMKVLVVTSVLWAMSVWVKRYKWAWLKSRKLAYDPPAETKVRR